MTKRTYSSLDDRIDFVVSRFFLIIIVISETMMGIFLGKIQGFPYKESILLGLVGGFVSFISLSILARIYWRGSP